MISADIYNNFLQYLLEGNKKKCTEITIALINENVSVKEIYELLFKKALYEVGELWEFGKITVATEHLASAIVETLLNLVYATINNLENSNKSIVVCCIENELHQIGSKMIADIFEKNGWETYYLGANTPLNELMKFIDQVKPDYLALSMSIYFHMPLLEKWMITIRDSYPNLPILVGGQAFNHGGHELLSKFKFVNYLEDLNKIEIFTQKLN